MAYEDEIKLGTVSTVKEVPHLPRDYSYLASRSINDYLKLAHKLGASDLHITCGARPFIRLNGRLIFLKHPDLDAETNTRHINELLNPEQMTEFEKEKNLDFCYELAGVGRFRVNIHHQRRGPSAIFRIIPDRIKRLDELNLPPSLEKFTTYANGLVLLTGPAGCGKSTTLAALVDIVNRQRQDHIVILEQPIEYVHRSLNCNITQREVGKHTESFHIALRAALREDPDVIVVGEMRDLKTISIAITAAETGHLVFGTLHTTNATRTIDRILDVFPPRQQPQIRAMVSESLRGAVSQQLLPTKDNKGRIPAVEILFNIPAVGHLIREGKTYQLTSVMQTGKKYGMVLMDDSIRRLLEEDKITVETAGYYAENTANFQ